MTETGRSLTPEQLIALNTEIASLVRAGVPLELGLLSLGRSVPSALSKVSQELANKLRQGQSLPESLADSITGLPRVYLAAVDAGLKSGELPRVLELLTRVMQQGLELRHRIEFAFLYPLIIVSLAYVLLTTCIIGSAEHWNELWGEIELTRSPLLATYRWVCLNWPNWIAIVPTLIFLAVVCWFGFVRRSLLPDRRPSPLLRLIPGLYGVVRAWHWALFCDTAGLLIEHRVALPTAIRMAGATTGNATIDAEMTRVADQLERGQSVADSVQSRRSIPPFLVWALSSATQPQALQLALAQGAKIFYERAQSRCDAIRMWLPLVLIMIIGGGAALIYALTCVLPIIGLFSEIGREGETLMPRP